MSEYVLILKKTNGDTVTKFVDRNYKLSKNLSMWEVVCDATKMARVDQRVVNMFQRTRDKAGHELIVTRLFSTPEINADVDGWDQSYHLSGEAIDFYSEILTHEELWELAKEANNYQGGYGVYNTHTHMDCQDGYWEKDWR